MHQYLTNADSSNYFLHWILSQVVLTVKAKQQVHGPHRSSEQQFESKNTFAQSYDYIILRIKWSFVWKKVFFNQGCFVPSLRGTVEAVYRKFIFFNTPFKTIAFIYKPVLFELYYMYYLTNVVWVESKYWGWSILCINWSHDVTATCYS